MMPYFAEFFFVFTYLSSRDISNRPSFLEILAGGGKARVNKKSVLDLNCCLDVKAVIGM